LRPLTSHRMAARPFVRTKCLCRMNVCKWPIVLVHELSGIGARRTRSQNSGYRLKSSHCDSAWWIRWSSGLRNGVMDFAYCKWLLGATERSGLLGHSQAMKRQSLAIDIESKGKSILDSLSFSQVLAAASLKRQKNSAEKSGENELWIRTSVVRVHPAVPDRSANSISYSEALNRGLGGLN
jgi:hypothetical protein